MAFGKLTNADKAAAKIRWGIPTEGEQWIRVIEVNDHKTLDRWDMTCQTIPEKGKKPITFDTAQWYTSQKARAFTMRLFRDLGFPIQDNGTVNKADVNGIVWVDLTINQNEKDGVTYDNVWTSFDTSVEVPEELQ